MKTYVHFNVWPSSNEVLAEAEERVEPLASGMIGCECRVIPVPYTSDRDVFVRKVMSAGPRVATVGVRHSHSLTL